MTAMLASVKDEVEAALALSAGADVIDLKDPRAGALGALRLPDIVAARAVVARRRPVSATLGDLPMVPELVVDRARVVAACGVDFVKVGLFDDSRRLSCIDALAELAPGIRLIGVLFADQRPEPTVVEALARAGFSGVMLDTAGKSGGGLRSLLPDSALERFVGAARAEGLLCGLAGSLRLHDIPPLLALGADYLGFRGALCARAERVAELDIRAIGAVRAAIPRREGGAEAIRPARSAQPC